MSMKVSGDYSFPKDYRIAFQSPSGNRVIDITIKGKEKEHTHSGGQLFQRRSLIEVFSYPDNTSLFKCKEEGKKLETNFLPPASPHYAVTPQDKGVNAVFIEIKKSSDPNAEGCKWENEPEKVKFEQRCWEVSIHNNNKLSMKDKEGYAVSEAALKIFQYVNGKREEVKPISLCCYPTYYLQKNRDYVFEGNQSFFLREV